MCVPNFGNYYCVDVGHTKEYNDNTVDEYIRTDF